MFILISLQINSIKLGNFCAMIFLGGFWFFSFLRRL
jgi:hypothetical protein